MPLPSQRYPGALRKAGVLAVFASGFITKLPVSTSQMLLAGTNANTDSGASLERFACCFPPSRRHAAFLTLLPPAAPHGLTACCQVIPLALPHLVQPYHFVFLHPLVRDEALCVLPALFESRRPLTATLLLPLGHQPVHPPTPPAPRLLSGFSMALICLHSPSYPLSLSRGVTSTAVRSPSLLV